MLARLVCAEQPRIVCFSGKQRESPLSPQLVRSASLRMRKPSLQIKIRRRSQQMILLWIGSDR
jgi:hypothetical protein